MTEQVEVREQSIMEVTSSS